MTSASLPPSKQVEYYHSRYAEEGQPGIEKGFGYEGHGYTSNASPPTCTKACETCVQHYRPLEHQKWQWLQYNRAYNDEDAEQVIRDLVFNSRDNLKYVRSKLERYGNAILKRWQKRSVTKRMALLSTANPDIYKRKWLAADLFHRALTWEPEALGQHHASWLLPCLDLPTLCENAYNLPLLLQHRTEFEPAAWAMFDSEQLRNPFNEGALNWAYTPHCVVMHNEDGTYGCLVLWNEEGAHRWDLIGFPRAHAILEAQSLLSDLLKAAVDLLVGAEASEGNGAWVEAAAWAFDKPVEISEIQIPNFFSAPPRFCVRELLDIFRKRLDAAQLELRCMQIEPLYVRDILLCVQGMKCHCSLPEKAKQSDLVLILAMQYDTVERWQAIVDEAEHTLEVAGRHAAAVICGETLPREYDLALRMLQCVIEKEFKYTSKAIRNEARSLPSHEQRHGTDGDKQAFQQQPLYWGLSNLYGRIVKGAHDPSLVLDFIDHSLLAASPHDKAHVNKILRPFVSSVLTYAELKQMYHARPIRAEYQLRGTAGGPLIILYCSSLYTALQTLLQVPGFARPAKHLQVEHLQEAHKSLAKFWEIITSIKDLLYTQLRMPEERFAAAIAPVSWMETKAYTDLVEKDLQALRAKSELHAKSEGGLKARKPQREQLSLAPTPVQTRWGSSGDVDAVPSTPKEKEKTRRSFYKPETPVEDKLGPTNTAQPTQQQRTIEVDATSLDLLQRVFTPIACAKGTANTKWEDFVSALMDAGCTSRHAGGSGVNFMLPGWGIGCVVIHRPHPDPTINPIMLGSFGRKFGRNMGWESATFVLKGSRESR